MAGAASGSGSLRASALLGSPFPDPPGTGRRRLRSSARHPPPDHLTVPRRCVSDATPPQRVRIGRACGAMRKSPPTARPRARGPGVRDRTRGPGVRGPEAPARGRSPGRSVSCVGTGASVRERGVAHGSSRVGPTLFAAGPARALRGNLNDSAEFRRSRRPGGLAPELRAGCRPDARGRASSRPPCQSRASDPRDPLEEWKT